MRTKSPLLLLAFALLFVVGFTSRVPAPSGGEGKRATYTVDKAHSSVGFKVKHLAITNVNGRFTEYDATVSFDPADLTSLQTTATINVNSVDTGIERRDNHLRSADFFEVEAHPTMTFVSKEVRNVDGNTFELVGDLTIKDVTKEIVLEGEFGGSAMMGDRQLVAFEATGTINRFDYGLQWNRLTEAGGLVVSENIKIILEIEAAREEG